jgi:hypothetical protein
MYSYSKYTRKEKSKRLDFHINLGGNKDRYPVFVKDKIIIEINVQKLSESSITNAKYIGNIINTNTSPFKINMITDHLIRNILVDILNSYIKDALEAINKYNTTVKIDVEKLIKSLVILENEQ